MFWFIFADLLYYTHLAALLEGSSDIGNSNFHLREIFFLSLSLLAHRTGPRWHAAELVHSCWFFQTHVYSHSASHFSEIPTQRDIVTLQRCECVSVCVCVCVQEWLMQSFLWVWHCVSWSWSGIMYAIIYPIICHLFHLFIPIYGQRSGRSISQHAVG